MDVIESGIGGDDPAPDIEGFREWNRTKKSRKLVDKVMTEREAISHSFTMAVISARSCMGRYAARCRLRARLSAG